MTNAILAEVAAAVADADGSGRGVSSEMDLAGGGPARAEDDAEGSLRCSTCT